MIIENTIYHIIHHPNVSVINYLKPKNQESVFSHKLVFSFIDNQGYLTGFYHASFPILAARKLIIITFHT